jgi:hypothetical protein
MNPGTMMMADRATARTAGYPAGLPPQSSGRIWGDTLPNICSVPDCPNRVFGHGLCSKHYTRLQRRGSTDDAPRRRTSLTDRFWRKVAKVAPDECWQWIGAKNPHGYGHIGSGGRGEGHLLAHRVSWQIANGQPIPDGMLVMHSCDNPACVNPAHLSLGTYADNVADMDVKGRRVRLAPMGEDHHQSVLTVELVRYIRASSKGNQELATEIGVTRATVRKARLGISWGHVT